MNDGVLVWIRDTIFQGVNPVSTRRKRRTPQEKLEIVLQGMRGDMTIAEVCREHGIYATQYYDWRDRLLKAAPEIFSQAQKDQEKERLENEKRALEKTVVELSVELQALKKVKRLGL